MIKRIGRTERRRIDDLCHKISRAIVSEAKERNSVIVIGDLKGIRKRAKGRRFRRILHPMPHHRLSRYIEYKALREGIPAVHAGEAYTSRTCHVRELG